MSKSLSLVVLMAILGLALANLKPSHPTYETVEVVERQPEVVERPIKRVVYEPEVVERPIKRVEHPREVVERPIRHEVFPPAVVRPRPHFPHCPLPDPFHRLPARDRCNPVHFCLKSHDNVVRILRGNDNRTALAGGAIAAYHLKCRHEATGTREPSTAARRYCEVGYRRDRAIKYCECMTRHGVNQNDWLVTVERECH